MNQENLKVKGVHTFTLCDASSERARRIIAKLEFVKEKRDRFISTGVATPQALLRLWQEYNWYIELLHKNYMKKQFVVENVTTTVGRSVMAQRLAGDNTYSGNINYTALGSDGSAENVGNTTLGAETYRKALSAGTASSTTAYIETFFNASEVSGTFEEFGNFIDGSGTPDSGQLFNRFTETVVKSTSETLNIQSIISLSNA